MTLLLTPEDINPKLAPGWTCVQVTTATPGMVRLQLAHGPEPGTAGFDGWRCCVESHLYDDAVQQAVEITHKYTPAHLRIKARSGYRVTLRQSCSSIPLWSGWARWSPMQSRSPGTLTCAQWWSFMANGMGCRNALPRHVRRLSE